MYRGRLEHSNMKVTNNYTGWRFERVSINGESPEGYPMFVIWHDKTVNKYSIENTETKERTEPFIDDVFFSSKPLETWTADYVVVRIGEKFFLCDNNGNCFFESDEPYIICRNVFVSMNSKYIITKKLEKIYNINEDKWFIVQESGGYNFAFLTDLRHERGGNVGTFFWIDCCGRTGKFNFELIFLKVLLMRETLINWYFEEYGKISFFNKDFEVTTEGRRIGYPGEKSKTFNISVIDYSASCYYSPYFHSLVGFEKYGELEVVEYNGRTHFFKANGEIEEVEGVISGILEKENYIIYRHGNKIYWRSFYGTVFKEEELTSKELYLCELIKMQLDSAN